MNTVVPDEALVERTVRGDTRAYDELVCRWQSVIYNLVYRMLGKEHEAEEVCQDAFTAAYLNLKNFRRESKFSSWLYRIAINLSTSHLRKRQRTPTDSLDEMTERGVSAEIEAVQWNLNGGPSVEARLLERDRARHVRRAIGKLADEQRVVLILKEYQGLTFKEISEVLNVPVSTVKTRMYAGLNEMKRHLNHAGLQGN
ncbi:MAG: sigma-70 family RNA polymerase sigma factor [Acidobacteriia bacterium]|nr:sigma-70 family RNA polymerase sigma factor [Terriglobia bacterium]